MDYYDLDQRVKQIFLIYKVNSSALFQPPVTVCDIRVGYSSSTRAAVKQRDRGLSYSKQSGDEPVCTGTSLH